MPNHKGRPGKVSSVSSKNVSEFGVHAQLLMGGGDHLKSNNGNVEPEPRSCCLAALLECKAKAMIWL